MHPEIMKVLQAQGSGKEIRAAALQIAEMLLKSAKAEPIELPLHLSPLPMANNHDSDALNGRVQHSSSPISESHSQDSDQSASQPRLHSRPSHSQRVLSVSEPEDEETQTHLLHFSDGIFDQTQAITPTQLVHATWDEFTSEDDSLDLKLRKRSAAKVNGEQGETGAVVKDTTPHTLHTQLTQTPQPSRKPNGLQTRLLAPISSLGTTL
jgi:hypothetical protein